MNSVALKAAEKDTQDPKESATSQNYTKSTWKRLGIFSLYYHINWRAPKISKGFNSEDKNKLYMHLTK